MLPAGTGAQARQVAEGQSFEIAVVDNRLPDERGFQVISAVQKPGVSTVALLRDEDTMDRIVGIELGADYYMRSPVNPRELVARVKQIFRKREYVDAHEEKIYVGDSGDRPGPGRGIEERTSHPPLPPRVQVAPHPRPEPGTGFFRVPPCSGRCGARRII